MLFHPYKSPTAEQIDTWKLLGLDLERARNEDIMWLNPALKALAIAGTEATVKIAIPRVVASNLLLTKFIAGTGGTAPDQTPENAEREYWNWIYVYVDAAVAPAIRFYTSDLDFDV